MVVGGYIYTVVKGSGMRSLTNVTITRRKKKKCIIGWSCLIGSKLKAVRGVHDTDSQHLLFYFPFFEQ